MDIEIIGVKNEIFVAKLWPDDRLLERSYQDFFLLSKRIQSCSSTSSSLPFPSSFFKKLLSHGNWDIDDHWNPFLTKGLKRCNDWLHHILHTREYAEECQLFYHETSYQQLKLLKNIQKENESNARRFQQYFMSSENIQAMVSIIKQYAMDSPSDETVYIEPSCGDGRLLRALAQEHNVLRLHGCDIDHNIIEQSMDLNESIRDKCTFHVGNYLDTTPQTFFVKKPSKLIIFGGPPYTCGGGTGQLVQAGDSSFDTGRDLPLQFIVHSAIDLHADVIIFLLPTRCQNTGFIERCKTIIQSSIVVDISDSEGDKSQPKSKKVKLNSKEDLVSHETKQITDHNEIMIKDISRNVNDEWIVSHIIPPNSDFDFCNRVIRQPGIIQIWEKQVSK